MSGYDLFDLTLLYDSELTEEEWEYQAKKEFWKVMLSAKQACNKSKHYPCGRFRYHRGPCIHMQMRSYHTHRGIQVEAEVLHPHFGPIYATSGGAVNISTDSVQIITGTTINIVGNTTHYPAGAVISDPMFKFQK